MKSSRRSSLRPPRVSFRLAPSLAPSLALAVAAALLSAACKKAPPAAPPPPPKEVDTLTLEPSEARTTGEYLGSLLSRGSVTVLPQVNGYVRSVLVRPGQKVAVGAPLIEVDAREESAALASTQAQLAAAQANLALAKQVRDRTEALHREGLATAEELDQRKASAEAAAAAAAAAQAAVTQRKVAVQFFSVRAAAAGVVGDVLVRVGDFINASTRITTINQAGALELSLAVPASRARGLAVGTPVEVLAEDGSVSLTSTVFYVAPDADPATQLVELKAQIPATANLRSSELVRARVVYAVNQALQVPARAVLRQSGQTFVYVVVDKGGKTVAERRPVELGDLGVESFVLQKGLAAGDRIVTSSLQALRDGAPVKVRSTSAANQPPAEGAGDALPGSAGSSPAAPASPAAAPPAARAAGSATAGSSSAPGPAPSATSSGAGR